MCTSHQQNAPITSSYLYRYIPFIRQIVLETEYNNSVSCFPLYEFILYNRYIYTYDTESASFVHSEGVVKAFIELYP